MKNKGIVWNGFFFVSEQLTHFCGQYSENVYSEKKKLGIWLLQQRLVLQEALCSMKLIKCPICINIYIFPYNLFVLF